MPRKTAVMRKEMTTEEMKVDYAKALLVDEAQSINDALKELHAMGNPDITALLNLWHYNFDNNCLMAALTPAGPDKDRLLELIATRREAMNEILRRCGGMGKPWKGWAA